MAKVKIFLDPVGNTMNMWWGKSSDAYMSEEVDSPYSNDVIVKNKRGKPIGMEIIGVFPEELNVISLLKDKFNITKPYEPILLEGKGSL